MKFFTKFVILFLVFGIAVAVLSGCADKGSEIIQTEDDSRTVYHQIGEYVACERTETDFGIIEIPQFYNLMPQSESTNEANETFVQIRDMLLEEIEGYKANGGLPEDGIDYSGNVLCSYRAGFCGDIVSVMLEYEDFYSSGYTYVSYNLNVENGSSPVDAAVVIENCDVSEDTVKKSIRYYGEKTMSHEWESQMLWTHANDFAPIENIDDSSVDFADKLDDMIAKSLEEPLVYSDGEHLYIVVYYPTDVGADYYCKLIAVSDNTNDIDSLSPETPFGTEFKSAITETEALNLVQHYIESFTDKPAGLHFEIEFLMPMEIEPDSYEPCYEFRAFYDEGDYITTAGRYAVSCYSAKLYEYDPAGDAYLLCPNETDAID